jgi:ABC-type glycerol-3-phosphate transport system substrate-binding protein
LGERISLTVSGRALTSEQVLILSGRVLANEDMKRLEQHARKQEAWQLAKWLGSESGNRAFAEAGWGIPATIATGAALGMDKDPIEKTWFDAIPLATVKPCFMRTTVWERVDAILGPGLEAIMSGQATAADKLKEVAAEADTILASA